MARPMRSRWAATAAGSSPTWSPRVKVSNGGFETPPARVVVTRRMRRLTPPVSGARVASTTHEGRHIDVVVIAANAQGRAIGVHRHALDVDRLERPRGDLAGLRRLDPVRSAGILA